MFLYQRHPEKEFLYRFDLIVSSPHVVVVVVVVPNGLAQQTHVYIKPS
jgi:hypothetical protein